MALDLDGFEKAIESLKRALMAAHASQNAGLDDNIKEAVRAGVIQNFEVSYEQSWKMMKRWLEVNLGSTYVDGVSRRELFRLAAEHHLIDDVDAWWDFHQSRNQTSHTYDPVTAEAVFDVSEDFAQHVTALYEAIKVRND